MEKVNVSLEGCCCAFESSHHRGKLVGQTVGENLSLALMGKRLILPVLLENNGERAVRNENRVETASTVIPCALHALKGITEARRLGAMVGFMRVSRALAISSPTLLRDCDLTVKSFLPLLCLLVRLQTAAGWTVGLFNNHGSSMSTASKVTALSPGAFRRSLQCDPNGF